MNQRKKTKAERREAELVKIRRKQKKGATLAGQIKKAQTNKHFALKKIKG